MYGDLGMSPVTCQSGCRKLDSDEHWIKVLTFAVGQFWLSSLQYPGARERQKGKVIKTWGHNGGECDGVWCWSVMVCRIAWVSVTVRVWWCVGVLDGMGVSVTVWTKWWHTHWTWPCEVLSMLWVSPDRVSSRRQSDQPTVLQLESNYKCACLWLEKISL